MDRESTGIEPSQPRRAEGALELRVWGATQDQLADGLARARAVLQRRGVSAGRAIVCQWAVTAHALDPLLPAPDDEVKAGADACREAYVAAVSAAGGDTDGEEDALAFDQGEDGPPLWNTIPTLRAYRLKLHAAATGDSSVRPAAAGQPAPL